MRPVEFAPEAIIQAGQNLLTAGRNITGFALRQKVGGGNPARLKQVWDEHQSSQAATVAEPVAELPVDVVETVVSVSKSLTDRIAALAVELNDRAVKAADRRVHEIVRSAGEQRAQAERELADAAETVDDLETKLDELQATAQVLEAKLADSQTSGQAQAVELAQLRERLSVTEQTAKAVEAQHAAELARMNATIMADRTRHQQEIDQVRAELAEQKKTTLTAVSECEQVRSALVTANAKAEAAGQAHQEQLKTAEREAQRAADRIAKAKADQVQARKEASAAREEGAKLTGKLEAMQTQIDDLLRIIADRQQPDAAQGI